MAIEIIDLTNSPPSPPRSSSKALMVLNSGVVSAENVQFKKFHMSSWACVNPTLHHTNHHQTTLWPASGHTHEPSQSITTWFQPNMNGHWVSTILEPVHKLGTFSFPHGARLKEPWTQREHELFLMGLIKYGKGHRTKISRHLLWNKTPQQVQSYAASFFKILQATYLYASKRRKPVNYSAGSLMDRNRNLMDATTSYSMQMVLNEPQRTLTLFPEKTPFSQVPPFEEGIGSSNRIDGFQMLTNSATTSMTASANGEVDLELRLGRC